MTETTSPAVEGTTEEVVAAAEAEEAELREDAEVTEEGRYIPYSGGSMGWFENSGVLKCELGNNYLFYTVMASDTVRRKQFQRWGERFNRRGDRKRFKRMTGALVTVGSNKVRGTTRDISRHGIRVQSLNEIALAKGDSTHLTLFESESSEKAIFECEARVVWAERIGKIRPVWNLGMTLTNLTPEQQEQLTPLLHD